MNDTRYSRPSLLPPGIKNLLIINGIVFLATIMFKNKIDLDHLLGMFYWTSPYFHWWQPLTHMFMHANFEHILLNMYALWMFGTMIENLWGTKRFLFFYFVCGFGAIACQMLSTGYELHQLQHMSAQFALTPTPEGLKNIYDHFAFLIDESSAAEAYQAIMKQLFTHPHDADAINGANQILSGLQQLYRDVPTVGASGAVMGVLLAFGMLFPNTSLYLMFVPIPIKAKYFVAGYALFELYAGFSHTESNVAHFAHLGGMLFGLILILYWNKTKRNSFY